MAVWTRIPVIVRAVLIGVAVTASATLPWMTVVLLNMRYLPGVVLHAGGDAMGSLMVLATGRQVSSQPIPVPTGGSGFDASFWLSLAGLMIVGAATARAFKALAESAREAPKPATV